MKKILTLNTLLFFVLFIACDRDAPEPEPKPEPVIVREFKWHLTDENIADAHIQLSDAKGMLEYIDRQLHKLDLREWSSNGLAANHKERAHYLEVRVHLLFHIRTLTNDIDWRTTDNADESEK